MAWQKKHLSQGEKSADVKKATNRAVWYLSQRDYGMEELYQKLCGFFTQPAAAAAMASMAELGYLDDTRYAQGKARSLLLAHKSRRDITQRLAQKGLARDLIESVLDELYHPEQLASWACPQQPADAVECTAQSADAPAWDEAQQPAFAPAWDGLQQPAENIELENATILIQRRYTRKLEAGRQDLVIAALTRRGFSYGIIREALAQVASEEL